MGETALINYEAHLTKYGLLTECWHYSRGQPLQIN
jgi:hypothetical protein